MLRRLARDGGKDAVLARQPFQQWKEAERERLERVVKDATPGAFLAPDTGGTTARTLALAARFPARIAVASLAHGELVYRLRSGLELRLGEPTDVRLKLAIVRRALRHLPPGVTYVDVSVPERPVAGQENPQLSSRD